MAVAEDAGLINSEDGVVLTSQELNDLSDDEKEALSKIKPEDMEKFQGALDDRLSKGDHYSSSGWTY